MQDLELNIGDKIGFVTLAQDVDGADEVNYFPVVQVTTRDGERAYKYQFPGGEVSSSAIRQSQLSSHMFRVERRESAARSEMIALESRQSEFKSALKRGMDNDLSVYPDFEKDSFTVVNRTNNSEYRVRFEARDLKPFASCTCKDFEYRRHVCKHIAETLQEAFFGVVESFGVTLKG